MVNNLLVHFHFSNFWVFHSTLVFTDSIHTKIKDKTIIAVINYESRKHHAVSALSYISNSSAGTVVLSYSSVAKPAVFPPMMRAVKKTAPK